jgi:hypothetical protein
LFGFILKEMFYVFFCERILIVERQLSKKKMKEKAGRSTDSALEIQSEDHDRLKKLRISHGYSVSVSSQESGAGSSLNLGQKHSDQSVSETSPQDTEKIRVSESKRAIWQDNKDDQTKVLRTDHRSSERLREGSENIGSSLNSRLENLDKLRKIALDPIKVEFRKVKQKDIVKVSKFLVPEEVKTIIGIISEKILISDEKHLKIYCLCNLALDFQEQGFSDAFIGKAVSQRRKAQRCFDAALKLQEQGFSNASDGLAKEAVGQCWDPRRLFDSALKFRGLGFSNAFLEKIVDRCQDPQKLFGSALKFRGLGFSNAFLEKIVDRCQDPQKLFGSALKLRGQGFSNAFLEKVVDRCQDPQTLFDSVLENRKLLDANVIEDMLTQTWQST